MKIQNTTPKNRFAGYILVNNLLDYNGSPCIEWTGPQSAGYGWFACEGVMYKVHRWVWEQINGPIPKDKPQINHHCNNSLCVNPDHLYCGTQKQNIADRQAAGHGPKPRFTPEQRKKRVADYYKNPIVKKRNNARMVKIYHIKMKDPVVREAYNKRQRDRYKSLRISQKGIG